MNIKELSLAKIESFLKEKYRAKQIWEWLYKHNASSFQDISPLPKDLREELAGKFNIKKLAVRRKVSSQDGTTKYLFSGYDGKTFETVFLPSKEHNTICISTQIGCAICCPFCATGKMGFTRNLIFSEIVEQYSAVKQDKKQNIRNIVLMGMGEPLLNYTEVMKAVDMFTNTLGLGWRHITLSTSGYVPGLKKLIKEKKKIRLSISLHAPANELRSKLVPMNKKYPIEELMEACKTYTRYLDEPVTFEYVLIRNLNDDKNTAKLLVKLLSQLNCKLNLIPLNPIANSMYEKPAEETIKQFFDVLRKKNVRVLLRKERGADIQAACGQLKAS